jgi:hypothetical protein
LTGKSLFDTYRSLLSVLLRLSPGHQSAGSVRIFTWTQEYRIQNASCLSDLDRDAVQNYKESQIRFQQKQNTCEEMDMLG